MELNLLQAEFLVCSGGGCFLKLRLLEKLKFLSPSSRGLSFFADNFFRTVLLIGYNQKSVFLGSW